TVACFFEHLGSPLIQALACRLSCDQRCAVYLGWHSQHELARRRFLGANTLLLAVAQKLFDGGFELGTQLGHRFAVKANHCVQPKNAPYKDVIALVELDSCGISFVTHGVHGLTPTRSRNSRASST